MGLYQAVKLASQQPKWVSKNNARLGPQYFMFGAPGSAACAAQAKHEGTTPTPGQHCLLAGPDNELYTTSHEQAVKNLATQLPPGVDASEGEVLVVQQGTVVLQAANPSASHQAKLWSPSGQYFVLKDNVALRGSDITNPQGSTDQSGNPDVQFGFNSAGGNAFENVTGQIAHRGQDVSTLGQTLDQHFAVALDTQLLTVPSIDYKVYPDGITGGNGADITGGFTQQSASDLATQLRLGALPINLKLISESQVSATLGKQALHQGLIAGAAGLIVVMLFLLLYYRLLGLIAIAGLIAYALYFYALIKLIPITLTLPGIAGLILTIGVAADANIVIFERVKEEIRAGRSIRSGIATGYKKGLTAIIDANVVTIMTAFILFVLATAEVQGFAFTLGIGVIVSLFTAVHGDPGDPDDDGRLADDRAPVGARRPREAAHVEVRLHGRLALLLLDVGRDPADRGARDRRPRAQPRDRLHLRNPDHDDARAARDRARSLHGRQQCRRAEPRGPEGRQGRRRFQISSKLLQPGRRDRRSRPRSTTSTASRPSTTSRSARRSGARSPTQP